MVNQLPLKKLAETFSRSTRKSYGHKILEIVKRNNIGHRSEFQTLRS